MVGKRHASGEIAAKLAQANDLAAKGKTQREISKALGVSIMTYHRWKKVMNSADGPDEYKGLGEVAAQHQISGDAGSTETIKRLELENSQLRRLVTDMLLEKLKLEEELRARQEARLRRPEKRQ
ncbi:MAG: helix-turn-helix domain-containing protein [Pseudomonadota bacterium]